MDARGERGIATLVAVMAMLLISALGATLVLTTSIETTIASNFRDRVEGLYAADAVIERSMADLLTAADWNLLLAGTVHSTLVDGPPSGTRTLLDGSRLDLTAIVNMANCRKVVDCSVAAMDASSNERPWGSNNPRWTLYAYGSLRDLLPTINSPYYVLVMVSDDPAENDGNPLQDGTLEIQLQHDAQPASQRRVHRDREIQAEHMAGFEQVFQRR